MVDPERIGLDHRPVLLPGLERSGQIHVLDQPVIIGIKGGVYPGENNRVIREESRQSFEMDRLQLGCRQRDGDQGGGNLHFREDEFIVDFRFQDFIRSYLPFQVGRGGRKMGKGLDGRFEVVVPVLLDPVQRHALQVERHLESFLGKVFPLHLDPVKGMRAILPLLDSDERQDDGIIGIEIDAGERKGGIIVDPNRQPAAGTTGIQFPNRLRNLEMGNDERVFDGGFPVLELPSVPLSPTNIGPVDHIFRRSGMDEVQRKGNMGCV